MKRRRGDGVRPRTLDELEGLAHSTLKRIDQRRFELLGMTMFVLVAFSVGILTVTLGGAGESSSEFEATSTVVRWSLIPLSVGFAAYLFGKERELRRLTHEVHSWELQAAERMRLLYETKDQLLTAVSHQVRTPLTKALGFAELLDQRGDDLTAEQRREFLGRMRDSLQSLDDLLANFIDIDRLWRGVMDLNVQSVDIARLARYAAAAFGADVIVDEGTRNEVVLDAPKVERILESLLSNAARHTPEGTNVWVRIATDDRGVTLTVEDDGPGIAAEDRDRVLRPFTTGSNDDEASPGTGLGLTLVERLAQLHGGRISIEARQGGGTAIHVFLPEATLGEAPPGFAVTQVRV